jgi:hypothetical protein
MVGFVAIGAGFGKVAGTVADSAVVLPLWPLFAVFGALVLYFFGFKAKVEAELSSLTGPNELNSGTFS